MLLAEPPPTQGDIHFRLGDTPVRIHPFFWLTTLILGLGGIGQQQTPPLQLLAWVIAVLLSIVVHEFGHAIVQRRYGGHPRIILYGLGGLAVCGDCDRSSKAQIQISLAGPMAGFILAAAILLLARLLGHQGGLSLADPNEINELGLYPLQILGVTFFWKLFESPFINMLIFNMLWVNVLWGFVNLLPIYPLDGGQVSRELCMLSHPQKGIILSLQISMLCAGAMVFIGLGWGSIFVALFFGYLAYSSYRNMEAYKASLW